MYSFHKSIILVRLIQKLIKLILFIYIYCPYNIESEKIVYLIYLKQKERFKFSKGNIY